MVETGLPVARTLNVLPGTRWFFNGSPLIVWFWATMLSPILMWWNDVLFVWGTFVPLDYQWLSALFDSLLAVGVAAMVGNVRKIRSDDLPLPIQRLLSRRMFHVGLILVWLALSLLHMYAERGSVNTWDRRSGPNYLYHNFLLFPFLGYVYALLLLVTASLVFNKKLPEMRVWVRSWLTLIAAAMIGTAWFWAGSAFDASHQKAPNGISKHEYSNPPRPWCGGAITVHICGPVKGRAPIK